MTIDRENDFDRWLRLRWMRGDADRYMRPDAARYMRPDADRLMCPDWERFARPEFVELKRVEARARAKARDAEQEISEREWLDFQREIAALRADLAMLRLAVRAQKALHHSNFQPRVPAGNPDGGEWTSGGDGTGGRTRLAGPLPPAIGHNQGPPLSDPQDIPKTEPSTRAAKNDFIKASARWLSAARAAGVGVSAFVAAYEALSWLDTDRVFIESYQDPPRTLDELQEAVSPTRQKGYHDHHNVERDAAISAGFPPSLYNGRNNLVRIPALKHWEITGWFMRGNKSAPFNGRSPREYLEDKSWNERRAVGLRALEEHGVLK